MRYILQISYYVHYTYHTYIPLSGAFIVSVSFSCTLLFWLSEICSDLKVSSRHSKTGSQHKRDLFPPERQRTENKRQRQGIKEEWGQRRRKGDNGARERSKGYLSQGDKELPLDREDTDTAHRKTRFTKVKGEILC